MVSYEVLRTGILDEVDPPRQDRDREVHAPRDSSRSDEAGLPLVVLYSIYEVVRSTKSAEGVMFDVWPDGKSKERKTAKGDGAVRVC